jgi:3-hydroxyisobutyrate dehydrogenase-like beta-hydroxyacid dehydrogenase
VKWEEIMEFGFIGLGNMGGGLARNLIRAGKSVLVFDLSPAAIEKTLAVGTSGKAAEKANELADCDVVFTSLPLPTHIEKVMLSDDGLLNAMKAESTYIDVSTIDPQTARKVSDVCEAKGIRFLACPLGKNPAAAEKAEEPIFVGGKKEVYEEMKAILQIVGDPIYYMGEVEASEAFKLISNMVGMTNVAVIAESIRLGQQAGIEPKLMAELLEDTGGKSFQSSLRAPWIATGDFAPRFGLDLALKDVRLGCEMADAMGGFDPKLMKEALAYFRQASEAGFGGEDCNAVYKVMK